MSSKKIHKSPTILLKTQLYDSCHKHKDPFFFFQCLRHPFGEHFLQLRCDGAKKSSHMKVSGLTFKHLFRRVLYIWLVVDNNPSQ